MKTFILFVVLLLTFNSNLIAQLNCPKENLYKTNFIGDGEDSSRLKFPLVFNLTNDSVIIKYLTINREFAAFRVLSKTCNWNQDFSEGKSEYKLMLYDVAGNKYPTLTIIQNKNKSVYFELLWENKEKRIFM